jgi:hypothetical protein
MTNQCTMTNQSSYGSSLPVAYRLVMTSDDNGNKVPALQGYYAWVGNSGTGGEWRNLETQDWSCADDKIPHPDLP